MVNSKHIIRRDGRNKGVNVAFARSLGQLVVWAVSPGHPLCGLLVPYFILQLQMHLKGPQMGLGAPDSWNLNIT